MSLSQFEQAIGHGRGSSTGPDEARDHGREIVAPVEAVLELGEVAWHVLGADGSPGSGDGGLDVAERGVDPVEGGRFRGSWPRAGLDDRVGASGIGDGGEAGEAVADDGAGGIEGLPGEGCDGGVAKSGDAPELERTDLPSGVVSTAATNGVLPAAPRPRLPPWRSPPM